MRLLSLADQKLAVRGRYPDSAIWVRTVGDREYLCFELELRPSATAARYRALFAYAEGERPLVWVHAPVPLRAVAGRPTPHLNRDGTLCLFDSTGKEWTPADSLADTIVPWTIRWLFHYEHWVGFGEWLGDKEAVVAMPKLDATCVCREDLA